MRGGYETCPFRRTTRSYRRTYGERIIHGQALDRRPPVGRRRAGSGGLREDRRLRGAPQGAQGDDSGGRPEGDNGLQAPGPRRRGIPHRPEVELRAHGRRRADAQVSRGQRRRDGARHLQGPHAAGREPAPPHRGDDPLGLHDPGHQRVHLPALGLQGGGGAHQPGAGRGPRQGLPGQEHPRHRLRLRAGSAHQRRPLHVRRGDRAAQRAGGQARQSPGQAAVPPGERPVGQAHHRPERRDPVQHRSDPAQRRPVVPGAQP